MNDQLGRSVSRKWRGSKKLFGKEVQKIKRGVKGDSKSVKDKDVKILVGKWRDGGNILMSC